MERCFLRTAARRPIKKRHDITKLLINKGCIIKQLPTGSFRVINMINILPSNNPRPWRTSGDCTLFKGTQSEVSELLLRSSGSLTRESVTKSSSRCASNPCMPQRVQKTYVFGKGSLISLFILSYFKCPNQKCNISRASGL